jgi:putative hydrolase of the HAD superfamily
MQMAVRAIFFDIGGTLRVTHPGEPRDREIIQQLMAILGEKSDPESFINRIHQGEKTYRRWCKPNFKELNESELWTRFLLPEFPEDFVRKNAVKLNQLWRDSNRKYILPDVVETMKTLSTRGYKLGLISNTTSSTEGYQLLEETGLSALFNCVLLSAEFGRRKPHPSIFIEAARRAEVNPEECAYVGDRPSRDLVGARQANFARVVIINTEGYFTDEFDTDDYDPEKDTHLVIRPDYWIRKLSELLEYFPPLATGDPGSHLSPSPFYDVALSTMWHVDQDCSFNEAFDRAKSIGIARFELNHQVTPANLLSWDKDRNSISTVHDPCPAVDSLTTLKQDDLLVSSRNEAKRTKALDSFKRTLELAVGLGARSVVVHLGSIQCDRSRDRQLRKMFAAGLERTADFKALREEMITHRALFAPPHLEALHKSLEEMVNFSRKSGVLLGLENRYRYYDLPLPEELTQLLESCQEDWVGFQFDTGHAFTLERLGLVEKNAWLNQFTTRLIGVHLHDVSGITDHQIPGTGEIDFAAIAPYLPENCQKTLEVGPQSNLKELTRGLEVLTSAGCITKY